MSVVRTVNRASYSSSIRDIPRLKFSSALKHPHSILSMLPSSEAVCKNAALCGGMDVIDYKRGFVSAAFEQGCDRGAVCSVSLP